MIGGLQGENEDLNNKYLKKKSKKVGHKYLEALKWISQHATWATRFCKLKVSISQPKADFAATKFSQADFAAAKFSLSLVRLSSNGYNFFISAPIRTPFEALDS